MESPNGITFNRAHLATVRDKRRIEILCMWLCVDDGVLPLVCGAERRCQIRTATGRFFPGQVLPSWFEGTQSVLKGTQTRQSCRASAAVGLGFATQRQLSKLTGASHLSKGAR